MKKLLSVLVVCACVFGSVIVNAEQITIRYLALPDHFGIEPEIQAVFMKENPGMKLEMTGVPEGGAGQLHDKEATMLAASDGSIDIFCTDVIWPPEFAAANWLLPLDQWFPKAEQDKYIPAMIDAQTVNGHIYGVPWLADWGVLFYRKDLLEQAGLQVPKTWMELVEIAQKLQHQPDLIGYIGNWVANQQLICEYMEFLYSNGGQFLDDTGKKVLFNSKEGIEAAQFMVDLANKYKVVQPGITTMDLDEGRAIFTEGKVIFHRNWLYVWGMSQYHESTKVKGKVGIALLPTFKEGMNTSTLGGWSWSVNAFTKHKEEAAKAALFLGGPVAQKIRATKADRVPPLLPVLNDPDVVAKNPEYLEMFKFAKYIKSRPKSPFYTQMSDIFQAELQSAIVQQKTAEQAMNDAAEQIQPILEQ
jgi:multiple sugar transport system substrate-binding protein